MAALLVRGRDNGNRSGVAGDQLRSAGAGLRFLFRDRRRLQSRSDVSGPARGAGTLAAAEGRASRATPSAKKKGADTIADGLRLASDEPAAFLTSFSASVNRK